MLKLMVTLLYLNTGTGAVFRGKLSTELPADRSARYSGYCAVRSKPKKVQKRSIVLANFV